MFEPNSLLQNVGGTSGPGPGSGPKRRRERRREDPVYDLLEFDGPQQPRSPSAGARGKKRKRRMSGREVGITTLLCLVGTVRVAQFVWGAMSTPLVARECQSCENIDLREVESGQKFPMRCRYCGRKCVLPIAKCKECSEVRHLEKLGDSSKCPHCNKTSLVQEVGTQCPTCGKQLAIGKGHKCAKEKGDGPDEPEDAK